MWQAVKIGRNDPCVCGSNQKYKKCCLLKVEAQASIPFKQSANTNEIEGLMKKISKITEAKIVSIEDLNRFFVGKSFDEIDTEYSELNSSHGPKQKAEELFDRVLEETSVIKRIAITEEALKIYPGLPDAWCLLGNEKAKSCLEAISYFEKAVDAGRKDLGEKFFEDNIGHFWGLIETRPFMRAKCFLADALFGHGKIDEAIAHYEDCLTLNPNDNQGLRYEILSLYLLQNRLEDVERIFKQYKEDSGAAWEFSKALYFFKKYGGESIKAAKQLNKAKKINKFVSDYISGKKKLPKIIPDQYQLESKEEAQIYVGEGAIAWRSTPDAISWLKEWE